MRRGRLGSALVLACLAACAPRASTGRSGGPTTSAPTPTDAPPIQTGQGGATATTTGGQRGTPTTAGAQRGTATTTGGQGGGATGSGSTGAATPADPYAGAKGGVGAFARTLLRPQPATRLVIEVFTQQGATPASNTLNHAASVLGGASHKPVSVPAAIAVGGGAQDWTVAQLTELADRQGKAQQGGGQAVLHLLFLRGTFQGDSSILGVAVRGDVAAVFEDQVRSAASPLAPRATIEDAVTEHEMGHLLGLVDLVLHTGRADPQHPGHSTNKASVMYWAVESDLVSQVLDGPPPVDFDNTDRADLETIRTGG
ncbi:MAG TPA: hypothetical protein VFA94_06280 [Acidimicrobiales bacterium]|nr:hypothetical protein [Acidimicrobiales bacterium]